LGDQGKARDFSRLVQRDHEAFNRQALPVELADRQWDVGQGAVILIDFVAAEHREVRRPASPGTNVVTSAPREAEKQGGHRDRPRQGASPSPAG